MKDDNNQEKFLIEIIRKLHEHTIFLWILTGGLIMIIVALTLRLLHL